MTNKPLDIEHWPFAMSGRRDSQFIRRRVIYSGRVQGVGFRYTTNAIAGRHPVSGYVRNRSDGTVELEVQGCESSVAEVLADVARRFQGDITDQEITDLSAHETEDADRFSIRM